MKEIVNDSAIANSVTATETAKDESTVNAVEKIDYMNVRIKDLLSQPELQSAILRYARVPDEPIIKKVSKPSKDHHTQKIEFIYGKSIMDAMHGQGTIYDETDKQFLDPVHAINKKYKIVEYELAMNSNMVGKNFQGYSATGLKLLIKKLEEVK